MHTHTHIQNKNLKKISNEFLKEQEERAPGKWEGFGGKRNWKVMKLYYNHKFLN